MSSLVYSPEATVRIYSRKIGEIIDVSEDVVSGSVNRVLGPSVSSLNISIINAGRKYDNVFTPMDRVVVYLRRIKTMLVFSGYLDEVPIFSAQPKSIDLKASCTLKRVANYLWDPTSPAANRLLGMSTDPDNRFLQDGGMSKRVVDLLTQVGGWPGETIHIGSIPSEWFDRVTEIGDRVVADAAASRAAALVGNSVIFNGKSTLEGAATSVRGVGPGTGTIPATSGRISYFLTSAGDANGQMALTGESFGNINNPWFCLPHDSLVYTESGPVPIRDVQVGQRVWSVQDDKPALHPVTGKVFTGKKEIIEVKTRGRSIRCTREHRVLILSRDGSRRTRGEVLTEWIQAGDLAKGDVVVALSGVDSEGVHPEPTPEEAEVCGWMVADGTRGAYREDTDGSYGSGPTRWALCLNQEERPHKVETLRRLGYVVDDHPDRCCVGFRTTDLHPWIAEVMRSKSAERFVPSWMWTASRPIQAAFLEGYISGDGSLGQPLTQGTITVSSASERLTREVRALAHLVGWGTGNVASYVSVTGYSPVEMWRTVLYREEPWGSVPSSYSRNGLEMPQGLRGQTVVSVSEAGRDECWDLEVDGPASFVAEGLVVHNCAMRWPYVNDDLTSKSGVDVGRAKEWWKNRKIMVVNPKNGKAVIVRAADWGPNVRTGRVIDVSQTAMRALGANTDDNVRIAFAPQGSTLGAVSTSKRSSAQLGSLLSETGAISGGKGGYGAPGDYSNQVQVRAAGCTFTVHKKAAPNFVGFVNDLHRRLGYKPTSIGGYSDRNIAGTSKKSNHAWGLAIDIDPAINGYYSSPAGGPYALPKRGLVALAREHGLGWGGEWNSIKDYMHFEVLGGPSSSDYDGVSGGKVVVQKWQSPIKGAYTITSRWGETGGGRASIHSGDDLAAAQGMEIYPVGPGEIATKGSDSSYGNYVSIHHGKQVYTFYAHMRDPSPRRVGERVTENSLLGRVGSTGNSTGPHLHLELRIGENTYQAALRQTGGILKYIQGKNRPDPPRGVNGFTDTIGNPEIGDSFDARNLLNVFDWYSDVPAIEGQTLTGYRALMNDTPLMGAVDEFTKTTLREFCSAPNGDFIAWFPDYFGHYGQAGKLIVSDLEIDGQFSPPTIHWSDQNLKTHQFVVGASAGSLADANELALRETTAGVASLDFPRLVAALLNVSPREAEEMKEEYLSLFGARVDTVSLNQITGPEAEFYFACQKFMDNWSQQYQASINTTFLPEAYPGMMACFPVYGIQGYIRGVTHTWNVNGDGFTTRLNIAPWSTIGNKGPKGLPRGAPL